MMINRLLKGQKALGHVSRESVNQFLLGHPTLMEGPKSFGEVTQTLSDLCQDKDHAECLARAGQTVLFPDSEDLEKFFWRWGKLISTLPNWCYLPK